MRRRDLLTQVLFVNLLLVVAAVVTAAIAANPDTRPLDPQSALVLGLAVALTILFNVLLIQRRFQPLEQLVDQMERADLSRPGANLRAGVDPRGPEEVARLHQAFARMLERLEAERRRASSAALTAQEQERTRVARDLHDEVNQSLTGLLLRLEADAREGAARARRRAGRDPRRSPTRRCRSCSTLARQLRPTALDDLGLRPALAGNVRELSRQGVARASFEAEGELGGLPEDAQLVVYRVAQEALINAVRHAEAEHVQVGLRREGDSVDAQRRATTGAASRSTRPPAGSGSAACASARCSSAASSRSSRGRASAQGFGSRADRQ